MLLLIGMPALTIFLIACGAVPIAHYLKRDQAWQRSDRTRESWYKY